MKDLLIADRLPCATAFRLAEDQAVSPRSVVAEFEAKGVRVGCCQLGLFGYEGFGRKRFVERFDTLPHEVSDALRAAAPTSAISCAKAWELADHLGVPRSALGAAADQIDIRIIDCQLGCFA